MTSLNMEIDVLWLNRRHPGAMKLFLAPRQCLADFSRQVVWGEGLAQE
jgi:hypothetical protein